MLKSQHQPNPLSLILDLLFPKFNLNYSDYRNYLTTEEIKNFTPFSKSISSLKNKNLVSDVLVCGEYQDPLLQNLILRSKMQGETAIAKDLTNLIYHHYYEIIEEIDYITFIPPDPARFLKRGYHLPVSIANNLSKKTNKPYITTLYKTKSTKTQISLDNKQRLTNLVNTFEIDLDLEIDLDFKNILIIDDVCTTGSTLAEATRVLLENFPAVNLKYQVIAG